MRPTKFTVILILLCLSVGSVFAQSNKAQQTFEQIALPHSSLEWIELQPTQRMEKNNFLQKAKDLFDLSENNDFQTIKTETDALNWTHHRLQQTYKNIPIEGVQYIVHEKEGTVHKANGKIISDLNLEAIPSLSDATALQILLTTINANKYAWEDEDMELTIKEMMNDEQATYCPTGSLVWADPTFEQETENFQLAYKFDVFSADPYERYYYYVDAHTGEILTQITRIHEGNANGTASTNYYGSVSITTDSYNGSYRLRETGRGEGIETYTSNNTTSCPYIDVTDADNSWTSSSTKTACEAHWGSEKTYDYFKNKHGQNSFDDNGAKIKSWVNFGSNYVNAFWNGSHMTYGDGNGTNYGPLTCLDVVGHEITHAITERTAGLIYQKESGALNESFSDIFGTLIEFEYEPNTSDKDWYMGEDANLTGTGFRNMSDPKAKNHPDTYEGTYWKSQVNCSPSPINDYCGVHSNSGVQNYWFYLLSQGGSGTNDNSDTYNLAGIGMTKAAKIAFRNLTVYLTQNSNYAAARVGSIQAATDLYGANSTEVEQVEKAWCAVGVGTCGNATPGQLTITAPNGGETFTSGGSMNITWTSTGSVSSTVKIYYSPNNGTTWNVITAGTSNDGSKSWSIPNINTNAAKIRIVDVNDNSIQDESDAIFSINPSQPTGQLTLTSPNGGETFEAGSSIPITWTSTGTVGTYVSLFYSTNNGANWINFANTPNDGSRNWTVVNTITSNAKIKITNYNGDDNIEDESDATFSINAASPSGQLTLTYPNGGETLASGSTVYVTWTNTGNIGDFVKLDYSINGSNTWLPITGATPNDGSRYWNVPTVTTTTSAKVRISAYDNTSINDVSNADFTISPSSPSCDASNLELGPNVYLPTGGGSVTLSTGLNNMAYTLWDYQGTLVGTTPSISVSSTGTYFVAVVDSCGSTATDSIQVLNATNNSSNVWPGDINFDGIVNLEDVSTYGFLMGETGSSRTNQDMNWYAHPATDWSTTSINNKNAKHGDANGDGIVDLEDGAAIQNNYSKTHNESGNNSLLLNNDGPFKFYLQPNDIPSFENNDNLLVMDIVIGNDDYEDIAFYGGHFTITYNNIEGLLSNPIINLQDSWLGTPNVDLFYVVADDIENQQISVGITRLDLANRIGSGKIGTLTLEVNPESIGSINELLFDFNIEGTSVHNSENIHLAVGSYATSIALNPEACPVDLTIAPYMLLSNVHQVANNISTTGNVKVLNGQDVTFKVNDATLNEEFFVELGASFGIEIDPCTNGANKPLSTDNMELYIQNNKRYYIINQ